MDSIRSIAVDLLDDHPDNPRLMMRGDVVDGIAAQIEATGEFDAAHALLVRPVGGRYQVVRGHQRKQAAIKAGLDVMPCWVREMTDDEAYLQLGFGNAQGEWRPIEIGLHALGLPEEKGGRGKKGGLSEYARKMGKNDGNVFTYRNGAEVLSVIRGETPLLIKGFLDKALHLAAIHKAPEELWSVLVDKLFEKSWSAADIGEYVKFVSSLDIPVKWQEIFLSLEDIIRSDKLKTRGAVENLVKMAGGIEATIAGFNVDHEVFERELHDWLAKYKGKSAWDMRSLRDYQERLLVRLAEAERVPGAIILENNKTWLGRQEDCDLLLTDPPYMTEVENIELFAAEWLPRALAKVKVTGRAYVFIGAYPEELRAYLGAPIPDNVVLESVLVWTYRNTIGPRPTHGYKLNWQAVLYFQGVGAGPLDCPVMMEQFAVQDVNAPDARTGIRYSVFEKPEELAQRFIMHSTEKDQLVLDPFAGTGTFLVVASKLGRLAKGCDTDEAMVEIAVGRGCEREGLAG
jgi:hypothetical protein